MSTILIAFKSYLVYCMIMPRPDGFATNTELMSLYEQRGRDLFVEAYEQSHEQQFDRLYEGKPLSYLSLVITRGVPAEAIKQGPKTGLIQEQLILHASDDVEILGAQLRWREHPEIIQVREATARKVGNMVLTGSFKASSLSNEAIRTEYIAHFNDNRIRTVSTDYDKPAKMTLLGALGFVEDADGYVQSAEYTRPFVSRLIALANLASDDPSRVIRHKWTLAMYPDLPLNGFESVEFLEQYRDAMNTLVENNTARLLQSKKINLPAALLSSTERVIAEATAAAERAMSMISFDMFS
jgi:hypothetical protein